MCKWARCSWEYFIKKWVWLGNYKTLCKSMVVIASARAGGDFAQKILVLLLQSCSSWGVPCLVQPGECWAAAPGCSPFGYKLHLLKIHGLCFLAPGLSAAAFPQTAPQPSCAFGWREGGRGGCEGEGAAESQA